MKIFLNLNENLGEKKKEKWISKFVHNKSKDVNECSLGKRMNGNFIPFSLFLCFCFHHHHRIVFPNLLYISLLFTFEAYTYVRILRAIFVFHMHVVLIKCISAIHDSLRFSVHCIQSFFSRIHPYVPK